MEDQDKDPFVIDEFWKTTFQEISQAMGVPIRSLLNIAFTDFLWTVDDEVLPVQGGKAAAIPISASQPALI